jgi:hypothetical protein
MAYCKIIKSDIFITIINTQLILTMDKYALEIRWGFIFAAVALLWMMLEKAMGWHDTHIEKHASYTLFFIPIAFLIYVLALRHRRETQGGYLTWKQGFISGMVIALVVAILSPLSQYIVHNFISPYYFSNIISYSVENGMQTQEEAEAYFNLNSYMMQATVGAIVSGAFTSAIVALVLRTRTA